MKKVIIVIVVVVLALVAVSIFNKDEPEVGAITIGYIGPQTGPSAVLGMDAIAALEIAVEEANANGGVNGREINLIVEDDAYLTKDTVNAYQKLVHTDGAEIVLVATYGGVFAVAEQAAKDNVIIIDPLDCNAEVAGLGDNIFCIATETESIGLSLAEYAIGKDMKNVAIMYSTKDTFMSIVAAAFTETFEAAGGTVVQEQFSYDDGDFRTQLTKIKPQNPEALVLLGHAETGLIMKQAREMDITAPFLATGTITSPDAQSAAQGHAEGTIFAYWEAAADNALARSFEASFLETVGRPPILPLTTHPAYDTMKILTDVVLPNIEGNITDRKIAKELLDVRDFQGTTGTITVEADGGARIKESVFRLVGGVPVKI